MTFEQQEEDKKEANRNIFKFFAFLLLCILILWIFVLPIFQSNVEILSDSLFFGVDCKNTNKIDNAKSYCLGLSNGYYEFGKDYLNYFGKIEIKEKDWKFYSNGKDKIGGKLKVKDIKQRGIF